MNVTAVQKKSCSLSAIPSSLCKLSSYLFNRALFAALFPPQNACFKRMITEYSVKHLQLTLKKSIATLAQKGFHAEEITLQGNHLTYSGVIVGRKETLKNGKWIFQVTGRTAPMETSILDIALAYLTNTSANLLMVNPPGVGLSEGEMTFEHIALVQNIALDHLEKMGAGHIAWVGHSFGATFLAEGVLRREFNPKVHYTIIRQMGFYRLSRMTSAFTKLSCIGSVIRWGGIDTDELLASEKLAKLGISDFILQSGKQASNPIVEDIASDGVIPADVSLGQAALRLKMGKVVTLGMVGHADNPLWQKTLEIIHVAWNVKNW